MKLRNLTKSVLLALMVASPLAGAETQYPAADFQPEIIKQDADLIKQHETAKAAEAKPAAPAPDEKTISKPAAKVATAAEKPEPVAAAAPKAEESSNMTFILMALGAGAAAFWFLRKPKTCHSGVTPGAAPAGPVPTGVAKYISSLPETIGNNATGVARYINSLPDVAPVTGVAKYIKTLPATESPYSVAPKTPTGVEKYLKALPETPKPATETGVAKYLKAQGLAA